MPLFDDTDVQSEEMAALLLVQDILSRSPALQVLLEAADASEAKSLIVVGPDEPPFNKESYTVGELESRLAWARVIPQRDGALLVNRPETIGEPPAVEGLFELHVRRQVRPEEYSDTQGRNDAWKYFTDQTSAMCGDFAASLDESVNDSTLRGTQIKRTQVPLYNYHADHQLQGIFIFAEFLISWGGFARSQ